MSRLRKIIDWLTALLPPPTERRLRSLAENERKPMEFDLPKVEASPLEKGRSAFAGGQHAEALAHFQMAIDLDPSNPWAWHGRGDSLQLLGEHLGALEAYEKACLLAPNVGLHHGGRANALSALNRDEAKEAWKTALSLDKSLDWMKCPE